MTITIVAAAVMAVALLGFRDRGSHWRRRAGRSPEPESLPVTPDSGPRRPGASVLLVSVDALRPDHMGVHGYPRHTTPNIDRWAAESVVFERAYCQAPHTSFSLSSLLLGELLYPFGLGGRATRPRTIAEIVQRYSLKTGAFFPPSVFTIDGERLAPYEETRFGFEYVKYEHLDAARRVDQVFSFLEEYRDRQVLVWVHFFDPHEPYQQAEGFHFGPAAIDRYDSEVALVDREIGRLFTRFRQMKPGGIIVLTADHGEEFGECGRYYHGNALSEPQVRVPLVIQVPGLSPRRVGGQAQVIDVPVTLLSLLDIPPPAGMLGNDLGPWLSGARGGTELPPAFAELDRAKMVVSNGRKLVCDVSREGCDLYRLERDPCTPVEDTVGTTAALRRRIDEWMTLRFPAWTARGPWSFCQRLLRRGKHLDLSVVPELLRRCQPWPEARRAAASVLASARSPAAREELRRAMSDPDVVVKQAAIVGAALLGDPDGLRRGDEAGASWPTGAPGWSPSRRWERSPTPRRCRRWSRVSVRTASRAGAEPRPRPWARSVARGAAQPWPGPRTWKSRGTWSRRRSTHSNGWTGGRCRGSGYCVHLCPAVPARARGSSDWPPAARASEISFSSGLGAESRPRSPPAAVTLPPSGSHLVLARPLCSASRPRPVEHSA